MAQALMVIAWLGLTAYALLGGADFGAGLWDMLAGSARGGADQRRIIEHSMGPVWEANHVWLIFILVVLWTAFPRAFASITSTLYVPLTCAALGIILRGSSFAFRKSIDEPGLKRMFGAAFAASSLITPFFFGAIAGAVASGRVPPGVAAGPVFSSWLTPVSALGGVLAVGTCAYLAAIYLTADARRARHPSVADAFRRRGLTAGVVTGAIAIGGIGVLHADARLLYHGLTHRAFPLVVASAALGLCSLVLLWHRHYTQVRLTAAGAVVCILWAWAAAQYPLVLIPHFTLLAAAAPPPTLQAMVVGLGIGALLIVPSLILLLTLFQRRPSTPEGEQGEIS
ncbi:MAG TPA: cytochrome d ubiquinol oxidase subunit II [Streptosporangiaceae bacterium]|jgi:cytochrome d ubiquinol oxidase subunit II